MERRPVLPCRPGRHFSRLQFGSQLGRPSTTQRRPGRSSSEEDFIQVVVIGELPLPAAVVRHGPQSNGFRAGRKRGVANRAAGLAQLVADAHSANGLRQIPPRLAVRQLDGIVRVQHEVDPVRRLRHLPRQVPNHRRRLRSSVRPPVPSRLHHGLAATRQSPLPDMQMAGLPEQISIDYVISF